nr:hypothetical protein Itr_chr01CG21090 [Ipomoea trifida]
MVVIISEGPFDAKATKKNAMGWSFLRGCLHAFVVSVQTENDYGN